MPKDEQQELFRESDNYVAESPKDFETDELLSAPFVHLFLPNYGIPGINLNSTTFRRIVGSDIFLSPNNSPGSLERLASGENFIFAAAFVSSPAYSLSHSERCDSVIELTKGNLTLMGYVFYNGLKADLPKTYNYFAQALNLGKQSIDSIYNRSLSTSLPIEDEPLPGEFPEDPEDEYLGQIPFKELDIPEDDTPFDI